MKKTLLFFCLLLFMSSLSMAQTLVHYWNFNNSTTEATLLTPSVSLTGGSLTHNAGTNAGFTSIIPLTGNTTGQGFENTNPNARNADVAGAHLRLNNPIGGNLVFALPTVGYQNIVIKYATRRSGSGAYNQVVDYSLDGTTYTNLTTLAPVDGDPTMQTLDFTGIAGANNNPNFKIKISFTQGGGGLEGNNRFDNFSLEGSPVSATTGTLVYYWNFNTSTTETTLLAPSVSLTGNASLMHNAGTNAGFTSTIPLTGNTTGQGFENTNPNARNADVAGAHLRLNNPIGGNLVFALPTVGYQNIVIKYATRRSGSGAYNQVVDYSLDGTTYTNLTTLAPVDGDPTMQTLDFTSIAGANNNPNFKIKISFTQGGGGLEGNNRFDNFSLEGSPASVVTLVHYWNFNTSTTENALLAPSFTLDCGHLEHVVGTNAGFTSTIPITGNTTGQGFENTNPNARNGDLAGSHLRFNNPIGGKLIFAIPTVGFENVIVKYATRRSGSGAYNQVIDYTTDGVTYTNFTTLTPVDGDPTLQTLDFSSTAGVNNNPDFKVRIGFTQGGGGVEGNNRFDNFSLEATPLGAGDNLPPTVAFTPNDLATGLATNTKPTITFNEDVRLADNSALTNTNVDALVELRLSNAAGTPVAFDATITGKVITITPTVALQNNQQYYVALKANSVADNAGNALTALASSTFTTIAVQTAFQPGDIIPVAYRMNATSTEDEIALLTLVNILPGTTINITDAKYTDNATAQCPGGLVWTAPAAGVAAGTVIKIQNDASVVNIGTLSGGNFGLSSGGDQAIVYSGTAANPTYITALSSNAWLQANTSCSGSNSKLPATLTDGQSAINLSAAAGNTSGNTANAYYNGPQTGSPAQLRIAILDPANWIGAASGTAAQTWPAFNFPGPPAVVSAKVLSQTAVQLIFNQELDQTSAETAANYTGVTGLDNVKLTSTDGIANTVTLNYTTSFVAGTNYTLVANDVKNAGGSNMFSPYTFAFSYNTTIGFQDKFLSVNENAGTVEVKLLLENPAEANVKLVLKAAPFSNTDASDLTFTTQTLNFTGTSTAGVQTISIPLNNDATAETDEYFVLSLEDLNGITLKGKQYLTVYIKDDDRKAPVATEEIKLNYVSSFKPNTTTGSTTEIVVHDAASQRMFMTSAIQSRLDIADFSNPAAITLVRSIDMTPYGGITSVAVRNGVVAVASPNANEQLNGSVVFFDTNGEFIKQVTVGALPDMIIFSPDGNKIMTANEGQPNDAYTVDPEGTVSVIDISGGISAVDQSKVTTISFASFNAQETALITAGVRKTKSTSTLAQDLEPEYVTFSADSKKAWVTLQENNAIAEINLENNTPTSIWPLGTKDFNTGSFGFDASDNSGVIHISSYPVKSYFMPDGIASFTVNNKTYLVSANEGDEKEYAGLTERTTVGAVTLDPVKFPNAAVLKEDFNLGRLRITSLNGDTDNDGDFDELMMNGARSFSIWDADTKSLVYDSKDDFELFIAQSPTFAAIFNADNESNALKSRSRAKGPEPEGVTVAKINGAMYAFVTLERVGGVMVYNITDPAHPKLVDYKNNRSTTSFSGDMGPEGIIYIKKEDSPDGKAYIAIANELSGNISVFSILDQDQVLTFNLPAKTYGDAAFNPGATSTTGAVPVYTSANQAVAQIENGSIKITGAGTAEITAAFPATNGYRATSLTRTLTVNKATQTITFTAIPEMIRSSAAYTLQATASSGLPVTFVNTSPLVINLNSNVITPLRIGRSSIIASQTGNANYLAATAVTREVNVTGASGELVRIHGALSPDGDNLNDFLMIEGAQNFPENRVTIVNRAGLKVFEIKNYDNSQNVFTGKGTDNKLLPAGTYYCLLVYKQNGEEKRLNSFFSIRY